MGGAGSQLLMNHRRAVFGCGPGVAKLQYPTVRTRLCMCQLGKDKVFARTGGKVNLGGGLIEERGELLCYMQSLRAHKNQGREQQTMLGHSSSQHTYGSGLGGGPGWTRSYLLAALRIRKEKLELSAGCTKSG